MSKGRENASPPFFLLKIVSNRKARSSRSCAPRVASDRLLRSSLSFQYLSPNSSNGGIIHWGIGETGSHVAVVALQGRVEREAGRTHETHGKINHFNRVIGDDVLGGGALAGRNALRIAVKLLCQAIQHGTTLHQEQLYFGRFLLNVGQAGDGPVERVGTALPGEANGLVARALGDALIDGGCQQLPRRNTPLGRRIGRYLLLQPGIGRCMDVFKDKIMAAGAAHRQRVPGWFDAQTGGVARDQNVAAITIERRQVRGRRGDIFKRAVDDEMGQYGTAGRVGLAPIDNPRAIVLTARRGAEAPTTTGTAGGRF